VCFILKDWQKLQTSQNREENSAKRRNKLSRGGNQISWRRNRSRTRIDARVIDDDDDDEGGDEVMVMW
jgi:hypothetical protein